MAAEALLKAALLGLVEGVTEFIPVSSTGHLILVSHWLGETGETAKPFPIYTSLMLFYFVLVVLVARGIDRLYATLAIRGQA